MGQRGREGVTLRTLKVLGPTPYRVNGRSFKRQIWQAYSSPGVQTKEMQN